VFLPSECGRSSLKPRDASPVSVWGKPAQRREQAVGMMLGGKVSGIPDLRGLEILYSGHRGENMPPAPPCLGRTSPKNAKSGSARPSPRSFATGTYDTARRAIYVGRLRSRCETLHDAESERASYIIDDNGGKTGRDNRGTHSFCAGD